MVGFNAQSFEAVLLPQKVRTITWKFERRIPTRADTLDEQSGSSLLSRSDATRHNWKMPRQQQSIGVKITFA